jgi:hypothetical protein
MHPAAFKQNTENSDLAQIKKFKQKIHAFKRCHCLSMDGQWRRRSYPVIGRWHRRHPVIGRWRRQHEATLMPHQVGLGVEALPALRAHELQVAGVQSLVGLPIRQLPASQALNLTNLLKEYA